MFIFVEWSQENAPKPEARSKEGSGKSSREAVGRQATG